MTSTERNSKREGGETEDVRRVRVGLNCHVLPGQAQIASWSLDDVEERRRDRGDLAHVGKDAVEVVCWRSTKKNDFATQTEDVKPQTPKEARLPVSQISVDLDLKPIFRTMLTIRRFEEEALALRTKDLISGSVHLCLGQEAIPAAALSTLGAEDRVVATYRGHGWAIACGVPLERLFAELLGRATGTNAGRAGSPYLSSPAHRFIGENSIVGAGAPIACGVALAAKQRRGVVISTFGDGATSQGAVHEAMVAAAAHVLPVIFVCENNGWSENTPIAAIARVNELSTRARGYGLPGVTVDGNDPRAVAAAITEAVERARTGQGASVVECMTHRLGGHYHADIEHYRPAADRELAIAADPIARLRAELSSTGEDELAELEEAVEREIRTAREAALAGHPADPSTARSHVVATTSAAGPAPEAEGPATELNYGQALNEALRRELAARPSAVVFGEDVAIPGGVFGVTRNLRREFGSDRVFDTAIAESAILGTAVGAAQEGLIPIVEIMWSDFLLVGIDQLINQAANVRYLHSGERTAPMVVRCQQGVTPGSCAQHSQSLEAILAHVPGLRVGMPATPQDAYAMLRAAVAEPDPCILIESRAMYLDKGPVYLDAQLEPIGGARITATGTDVAIISWGRTANYAREAAGVLTTHGVSAMVLDLRWLTPLDRDSIASAASSCGRVIVAHEANLTGGFGAEVVATLVERSFFDLEAPPLRIGAPDVRMPSAPALQDVLVPTRDTIVQAALALLNT